MLENSDNTINLREYFKVIRSRLWVIFTIFILTTVSGTYVIEQVLPKIYTATSKIQVFPRNDPNIPGFLGPQAPPFDPIAFQSALEILQSGDVMNPVIKDLKLDEVWAKRDFKSNMASLPPSLALEYMHRKVSIDYERGTNILEISADSQDNQEASNIANAIADRYKALRDDEENKRNGSGEDAYREKIATQQKLVEEKRAIVETMQKDMHAKGIDIADVDGNSLRNEQDLSQRQRDLLAAKQDADNRRVLVEQVKGLNDDDFINTMIAIGRDGGNITALRASAFKLESDIANLLKEGFDENHPRVESARAELARQREQITEMIAGMRRAIVVDVAMAEQREAGLKQIVTDLTLKIAADQGNELAPYREALHERDKQQSLLDAYTIHLNELQLDRSLVQSPVRIFSRASPPDHPSKPNKSLLTMITVAAGIFFGIVVAFLIEYLDTSIKTMADAEQLLGLPVLTVIPNKGGPIPLNEESARLPHAEGYRILRAKLNLKVENGIGPALSVLSGGPGEGKSTTIYNLAVVCAQAGQSVILVDCDLRRPTIHDLLNMPNDHGVANYLRGDGDAVEFIQQTSLPSLHVLTAGAAPSSEVGSLSGDKIRHMLDDLKQRYDIVLIDSPPVLGISDGSIIAREVDYVILVIQHRRYPRDISLRAKRAIEEVHGNCIGMVLNSVAIKSDDSYYYYSNYGNYYKKADRQKTRKHANGAKTNGKPSLVSSRQKDSDSDEF